MPILCSWILCEYAVEDGSGPQPSNVKQSKLYFKMLAEMCCSQNYRWVAYKIPAISTMDGPELAMILHGLVASHGHEVKQRNRPSIEKKQNKLNRYIAEK